jgi:hypothetical protein
MAKKKKRRGQTPQARPAADSDALIDRAISAARKYPIAVGDVVGHDSVEDFSGDVLDIAPDGVALVDFGSGVVVRLPAAECFDVNLARHLAVAESRGQPVRDVAAAHRLVREQLRLEKQDEMRRNRHRLS